MANDFAGVKFNTREVCENRLSQYFVHIEEGFYDFYETGIMKLSLKVIAQSG